MGAQESMWRYEWLHRPDRGDVLHRRGRRRLHVEDAVAAVAAEREDVADAPAGLEADEHRGVDRLAVGRDECESECHLTALLFSWLGPDGDCLLPLAASRGLPKRSVEVLCHP